MNDKQNVKRHNQGASDEKGGNERPGNNPFVSSGKGNTGESGSEIISFLEANWQKSGFILVIFGALLWFAQEYRSAQALRTEEASLAYSNVMSLYGDVTGLADPASDTKKITDKTGDTGKKTDQLNRFLDESQRIAKEFNDTTYGKLAGIMRDTLITGTGESAPAGDTSTLTSEIKYSEKLLNSSPLDVLGSELSVLTFARNAAFSEDAAKRAEGQDTLKALVSSAGVFSVEAAVSLAVSYFAESTGQNAGLDNSKISGQILKKKNYFQLLNELVRKNPAAENTLVNELTRYGISYKYEADSASNVVEGKVQ